MRVISGTARGTKINSIDSIETRPTLDRVKESLFNIIQNKLEDAIVLDLFAGSGAIGIECISRGQPMTPVILYLNKQRSRKSLFLWEIASSNKNGIRKFN